MFKVYVFSKMEGVVMKDGKPVEGAVIKRTADHYNDKAYYDQTVSDENGHFEFGAITTRYFWSFMFDTVVRQVVYIEHEGTRYLGWDAFKNNAHHRGELIAKDEKARAPIRCTFDLDQEDSKKQILKLDEIRTQIIHGLCELN